MYEYFAIQHVLRSKDFSFGRTRSASFQYDMIHEGTANAKQAGDIYIFTEMRGHLRNI